MIARLIKRWRLLLLAVASVSCMAIVALLLTTRFNLGGRSMQMADRDTPDTLFIAGLGAFQSQTIGSVKGYCFSKTYRFRGQDVELVVYPNEDGTRPTDTQRVELESRLKRFEAGVDSALQQIPSHLTPLCTGYQIAIDHLTPAEILAGFKWRNVKLEPEGAIECYTTNHTVTDQLDIVIRFSSAIVISKVHFDG